MQIACIILPLFGILVERTRRPELVGESVALCVDERLQVVSEEAAASGIRPGQRAAGARSLCPRLFMLPYDRPLYEEAAGRIRDVLAVESSVVEPVSPEAAFVELTGRDIAARLQSLMDQIGESITTPSSPRSPLQVGLARTRLLAEEAARRSRDGKLVCVRPDDEAALLAPVKLAGLAQLAPATRARLARLGVETLGHVRALPRAELLRQLGSAGLQAHRLAFGEDGEPVKACWPPPAVEARWSFDAFSDFIEVHVTRQAVEHALGCLARSIAAELKSKRAYAQTLCLTLTDAAGGHALEEERLDGAVSDAEALARAALRLFCRMEARMELRATPLELLLKASGVGAGSGVQLTLLDERGLDTERQAMLAARLAELRQQFGLGAVVQGMPEEPRRIGLFTYPLTHRRAEPVDVEVNAQGEPVRVARVGRSGRVYDTEVCRLEDVWTETRFFWGEPYSWTVFRVELEPGCLYDLHHLGYDSWQLGAVAD